VGALVASSRFSVDATAHASRTEADGRHAGVYARYDAPSASLQAGILRGSHDIDSRRGVAFGGYEANLQGEAEADTTQYFLDASRVFDRGSVQLVPFANLARVEVDSDGFDETGGDAALHVGGGVLARTFASAGLHAEWEAGAATRLWGSVAWLHASGDGRAVAQQRFVDGTAPFVVSGADLAGDTALLDLGLRWRPGMRTTLEAAYNGRFGGGLRDQGGRVS